MQYTFFIKKFKEFLPYFLPPFIKILKKSFLIYRTTFQYMRCFLPASLLFYQKKRAKNMGERRQEWTAYTVLCEGERNEAIAECSERATSPWVFFNFFAVGLDITINKCYTWVSNSGWTMFFNRNGKFSLLEGFALSKHL